MASRIRSSPLASPSHVSVSAVPSTVAVIPGDALYAARLHARGSADAVADTLSNTAAHAARIPVREMDFICRSVYPSFQQRTSPPIREQADCEQDGPYLAQRIW